MTLSANRIPGADSAPFPVDVMTHMEGWIFSCGSIHSRGCGARQEHTFPWAYKTRLGVVPALDRGLGHTAPTYYCRDLAGSFAPTAFAASSSGQFQPRCAPASPAGAKTKARVYGGRNLGSGCSEAAAPCDCKGHPIRDIPARWASGSRSDRDAWDCVRERARRRHRLGVLGRRGRARSTAADAPPRERRL